VVSHCSPFASIKPCCCWGGGGCQIIPLPSTRIAIIVVEGPPFVFLASCPVQVVLACLWTIAGYIPCFFSSNVDVFWFSMTTSDTGARRYVSLDVLVSVANHKGSSCSRTAIKTVFAEGSHRRTSQLLGLRFEWLSRRFHGRVSRPSTHLLRVRCCFGTRRMLIQECFLQ